MTLGSSGTRGPLPIDESLPDGSFTALLESLDQMPRWKTGSFPPGTDGTVELTVATTVLALRWRDGVAMAGDRRATAGNIIAHKRMRKVYPADDFSAVAISGTAGMAVELIRLFQTELEHYEKIEGTRLSLEGKANYLSRLIRGNLSLAFQGLAVVPIFAGFDERDPAGKLFSFDVIGGRYEEEDYATTGSGGFEARAFLKSVWNDDLDESAALTAAVEALVAAAEEDSATGGPDLRRGIMPSVVTVTADGYREIDEGRLAEIATGIMERRP